MRSEKQVKNWETGDWKGVPCMSRWSPVRCAQGDRPGEGEPGGDRQYEPQGGVRRFSSESSGNGSV